MKLEFSIGSNGIFRGTLGICVETPEGVGVCCERLEHGMCIHLKIRNKD